MAELESAPPSRATPASDVTTTLAEGPECSDGGSLLDTLFGADMRACLEARDESYEARSFGHRRDFDPERFASEWPPDAVSAARAACLPWVEAIERSAVPQCADEPAGFVADGGGEKVIQFARATEVLQAGFQRATDRDRLVAALLKAAELALCLSRGKTGTLLSLGAVEHVAGVARGWISTTDPDGGLEQRRRGLVSQFPTVRHRQWVTRASLLELEDPLARAGGEAGEKTMPPYMVSAIEDGMRQAVDHVCKEWASCVGELDALESSILDSVDKEHLAQLSKLASGTDLDALDGTTREAAMTFARSQGVKTVKFAIEREARVLESLRDDRQDVAGR